MEQPENQPGSGLDGQTPPSDALASPLPVPPGAVKEDALPAAVDNDGPTEKVSAAYIWFQVLAQFGVFMAFITPLAISLTIRVDALAPGHEEYLAYITGSGSIAVMLTAPLFGQLSDRTRTRWGRRRPWIFGGMLIGVLSLFFMALAPSIFLLGVGWVIAQMGWGQALQNLTTSLADKLPEEQRGKVAGLGGFATQVAPVVGVVLVGGFTGNSLLMFLLPGIFGVLFVVLFVVFSKDADSRSLVFEDRFSVKTAFTKFLFNPVKHVDFSLVWLGRFLFFFGLTLNTTFAAFFFASRLNIPVAEVAGIVATLGGIGIIATTLGAIGGGFLSDRLRRRRALVLAGAIIFAAGVVVQAVATDIPVLFAGSLIASVGIGAFSAIDQALVLDVLPQRGTDAGRFMGIIGYATSIPQGVAPFIAPLILGIGISASGEKNYTLLYLIAGVITLAGGLVVTRVRSVR